MNAVLTCRCWHTEADHVRGRTSFPHPPQHGACMVPGCGCKRFRDADTTEENAA